MSFVKDPAAVLEYEFDWSPDAPKKPWLAAGETITDYTVEVPTGLTKDSDAEDAGTVTVWLSGGTVGAYYQVTCQITTNQGRTDARSVRIIVRDR